MNKIILDKLPSKIKEGYAVVKIDPTSGEEKTASGLYIPTASTFVRGEVVKAYKLETYDIDDVVYLRKDVGTELSIGEEKFILTVERDLFLAV
jgi:co-chaperonin GroES (HSP10)